MSQSYVEASAVIQGAPDIHVKNGSTLHLVCSLLNSTEPPVFIFWYHGARMINYDKDPNILVRSDASGSVLIIRNARQYHTGNYTCLPSNVRSASVNVHVLIAQIYFVVKMSDANAKCFKCKDAVCTEDQLTCQNCKNPFHFMCVGQAESSFRKMSKDRKAGWKCIDCKDVKEKEQNKDKDNRNDQNKEKSKKESKNQERDAFNSEMKTMEENGNKLMDYLNSKFQSLENSIKDQKDDVIKALNLKVKELEEKLEERDQKIADLEDRMDFIENRSRISNVEIRNMPETKNEDVQFLVESIGHTLGISVKEGDIQIAHRVQNRDGSNKNRPIIAHLGSRYIRNKWLKQYKDYKRSDETPAAMQDGRNNMNQLSFNITYYYLYLILMIGYNQYYVNS
ncbi:hypothetical protein M8J77_021296 [Diaphorina citri]|nr:hypothetical protein M8J77_021296 [Diaphorina citri]